MRMKGRQLPFKPKCESEDMILSRKLASIRTVTDILPIEGRDRIELAAIDGWSVIVKKDEFQIGDKCIYCEIDSVLPEKEEFEFLRSKKFRIRTMKMAGVISQGICFPMSMLPEGKHEVNDDVTELMGVTQYTGTMDSETDVNLHKAKKRYPKFLMRMGWFRKLVLPKKQAKGFPSFISKTDETRIQNAPFYLKSENEWVATEKLDGQSGTFFVKKVKGLFKSKYDFGVCSRNLRKFKEDNSSFWRDRKSVV